MNVLILTPDAVGSTLLQRLITIYMQFHNYDRPVINLHELTNGLTRYHNSKFNQEVLGKKEGKWGYYQSLSEITQLLSGVDHYKTSRLAHYHIRNRQDPIGEQLPFYEYLNENFYIISCRRHNIFEHALSWSLSKVTKKLNVYTGSEKIDSFFDLYRDGIELDPNSLIQTLNAYKDYVEWCNNHFQIASYFFYEEHLPVIERYILNLPIFAQQTQRLTWQDNFNQDFDTWNLCHYVTSDLGTLALDQPEKFALLSDQSNTHEIGDKDEQVLLSYNRVRAENWPKINTIQEYEHLPSHILDELAQQHNIVRQPNTSLITHKQLDQPLINYLPQEHQDFVKQNQPSYDQTKTRLDQMVSDGILVSHPPIKKQTLLEKKHLIRNYHYLLNIYNQWILQNPSLGQPLDAETLDRFGELERARWNPKTTAVAVCDQPAIH